MCIGKKTVVMTGATGFLGRNLLSGLLEEGYEVYIFARSIEKLPGGVLECGNLRIIRGDLDELDLIEKNVSSAQCFIHLAWEGVGESRDDREIQQRNVSYSKHALEIAQRIGCGQFYFMGSQAEYGKKYEKISEDAEELPVSEYGRAKLAFGRYASGFCKDKGMRFIHMRIFSVYGYGDRDGTLVNSCIRGFGSGEKVLLGPCRQKWNFLYVGDFVRIVLKILKTDCPSGIYNVAGTDTRILQEFVEEMYACSNRSGSYEFAEGLANAEGSPSLEPDIGKLQALIGVWEETAFWDGIKEVMACMGLA